MGYYGITGWSGGGRRPINYGLKAGQFRMTKYNIPQNTTIINNNISIDDYRGGYKYNYFDNQCYNNSTPSWLNWMMGIGLGTSLLGSILSLFGGNRTEAGAQETGTNPADTNPRATGQEQQGEFDGLKQLYPDGSFSKIGDTYYALIDGVRYESNTIDGLLDEIPSGQTAVQTPEAKDRDETPELTALEQAYQSNDVDNYAPVKFEENNLANIFKNISGVFDYGKDSNGREIGDFENAKADLQGKTEFKKGDIIQIGGKNYKILNTDGFVYLQDVDSTRNGNQVYILEKTASGTYQLSQRSFTGTEGFGRAAWPQS